MIAESAASPGAFPFEFYDFGGLRYLRRPAERPGLTLHFTHATGFHAYTYRPLLERMPADLDVHAVDLRGHGGSRALGELERFDSWQLYVDDLVAWLDARDAPVLLAGHSVGGTVSVLAASARPAKVVGLLLLEPVLVPFWLRPAFQLARLFGRAHETPLAKGAARRKARFESHEVALSRYEGRGAFTTWPFPFLESYVREGLVPSGEGGVELACSPEWESRSFALTPIHPFRALRPLPFPASIVVGGKGTTCPPASSRELARKLGDAEVVRIPEASHFLPMEHPDRVLEELERLRARMARAGSSERA